MQKLVMILMQFLILSVSLSAKLAAQQMIPQSETRFDSTGAAAEFFVDTNGIVTHLILSQTEGDARYDRKP